MHLPLDTYWKAVKRILRYLKDTLDIGMQLYKSSLDKIVALSDSDWASCADDTRATLGSCIFFGSKLSFMDC